MFPLDLSIKIIQVFDEFFFLSIFTKHGGHLFTKARDNIRMDFGQSGTLDEVVELKCKRFSLVRQSNEDEVVWNSVGPFVGLF